MEIRIYQHDANQMTTLVAMPPYGKTIKKISIAGISRNDINQTW